MRRVKDVAGMVLADYSPASVAASKTANMRHRVQVTAASRRGRASSGACEGKER
jgi:hypothetical protein